MTDADYAAAKERVFAIAKQWQEALGLCWWDIDYAWSREHLPTRKGDDDDGYSVIASTVARWQYGDATITVCLPLMAEKTDDEIAHIMVHEFLHIMVNETRGDALDWLDHEERVCTQLTKAVFWVRERWAKKE